MAVFGRRGWIAAMGALAGGSLLGVESSLAMQATLQLRFNLDMHNPTGRDLPMQRLWMYLPVDADAWWTFDGVETSLPHELHRDAWGHVVLHLSMDRLGAYARRSAGLVANLKRSTRPMPRIADMQPWLKPERHIEADHEAVVAQARELRSADDSQTVRGIYDFVRTNLDYAGYAPEDYGALYALQRRRGDCTEYASLVVALCRASAIPARMVEGYVTDRSFAPRPMDFHDWAEVLVDGRWQIVDAQKGALAPQDARYIAFRYYRDTPSNGVGSAHRYRVEGEMVLSL